MKGQTQIMSAVLLTGIMIGLISVAYIWGGPMIQKQKDVVKLKDMETFMQNLNKEIKNVAKNGGTSKLNVELPGKLKIQDTGNSIGTGTPPDVDRIILQFETQGTVIQPGEEIVLWGQDDDKTKPIGSEAGVILEEAKKIGDKYRITIKLFYRKLEGQSDSFIIDLVPSRRTQIGSLDGNAADKTIIVSNLKPTGSNPSRNRVQIKL